MVRDRPDPDELLELIHAEEARAARGRLKVFFGACAGVGKTYAMLEAARARRKDGIDVVIGWVETHGRAETEVLLDKIGAKYREYGIPEKPFAIVKADAGTYGMGIMTVRDVSEVTGLNRKQRNKMAVGKEGLEVSSVIIQEGVPTFESIHDAIAEPVVYMIDRFVVGGFYRVHTSRGKDENLNAPGAQFVPLAFEAPCIPDLGEPVGCAPNRFYAYGVVARLAQLAAAIEVEELAVAEDAVPA